MQVEEKTKLVCQPEGFYGPLTERELVVSILCMLSLNSTSLCGAARLGHDDISLCRCTIHAFSTCSSGQRKHA